MSCTRLIDFLDPKLSAKCEISSNGVSDDYYALSNLTSPDANVRRLGFMAYSATKPPIEIILNFKWKISLKSLKASSLMISSL